MATRRINYQWITWGSSSAVEGGLSDDVRARIDADCALAEQLRVVTRRGSRLPD